MMIFCWRSEAARNYAQGHLFACADSAEAARALLRAAFPVWVSDRYGYLNPNDDDDKAQIEDLRKTFDNDIAAEPIMSRTFIVEGSE
jgi:hypothetical protein